MVVKLPIVYPSAMIPIRLPEFYYKMKNKLYPDYLHHAFVALGRAASKKIRTAEEKEQDLSLIQKSLDILKLKTDIRNPCYLWACVVILNYCANIVNQIINETALLSAKLSVKISKIYQLDLSKISKLKYSEEELEFRRRVFWSFYGSDKSKTFFSGSLPTIQDLDIVVNLPENDIWWRYGGECNVEHPEITFWNLIANSENTERYSKGDTKNYVKTRNLCGEIFIFAKRRWLKKVYNPDDDNYQLVRLIDNLNKFEETIVKNPPVDSDLIEEACSKYKDTIRFTMDIEHILYKYAFTQYHLFLKSTLYQTEMVRVEGIHMHTGRIVSAKNVLVDTAKKQIDSIYELSKALPLDCWENSTVTTGLMSAITCLNSINISSENNLDTSKKIENLKEVYEKMSSYSEIPIIFLMYLDRLSKFINESHKENEKTMKLTDYLYIKDTFAAFVNQYQEAENKASKELIRNSNIMARQSGTFPRVSSLSNNNNSESSYKTNYDQYIKYSKLLEETNPNSIDNYFYEYKVGILLDAIVQDIINNPVNNQSKFEPQLVLSTIDHNNLLPKMDTEVDSENDEKTYEYDWADLDKTFWP
ncbi:hypothetical protein BB559_000159 [Furculomyces boomerangus]|uniref:Xylanolytic transcriptional activator regulatory domain-containing protein n=1 Tax=Furculomyces boomerangus TaxID=61424 RepID=A0A2T9Z689_9FUNG|nr:hypothetical protein BB559_000159 [Furculomyces boomerangus]